LTARFILRKGGDSDIPLGSKGFAVQCDALNLVQGLGGEMAFSAKELSHSLQKTSVRAMLRE
jgi:hypothetical protein